MFNKDNKKIYILFVALFVVSFGIGYFVMDDFVADTNIQIAEKPVEELHENIPDVEIIKEENRITPNTFAEERIHYKECGHLDTNVYIVDEEWVNLNEDELRDYLHVNSHNLDLISFSNVKVVLWGEKNHLCKEHYVIGEKNGNIAIFTIGENGQRILDREFSEYPINFLIEMDQQRIKEGIVVNSEDELSNMLQNFIS